MVMWFFNRKNLLTIIRRWLYVFSIGFWLFMVLGPISVMAYLTFHRILIPIGSYSIPLQFFNTGNFFASSIANVTLDHWIPELNKHPGLAYSVSLKLELFCNRNRADDLFRFPSTFRIDGTDVIKTSNFIMNCDSRSIYRHNNIVVPYNLRFWVSPVLSNLNKNVNVEFEYLKMTGMELVKHLKEHVVHVSIEGHVIVNDDNTFLELTVQRDGFRYYLQKYPIQSFVYGVLIFWSFSVFFSLVIAFESKDVAEGESVSIKEEPE
ncbi:hypothetical protein CANTEDRAFT_115544 [Yamadazyma tenuis ATCC 10573]|uniref:Seipin n=1 Tax=Candida tenuis (strain ATCC 10573 / BCRC 21748 / CBS 615 / JCM 9827 / NBRC 10315 / NRRL Y-1498 / VKM Y-70) TaxID=590646 RepID=G3BAS1_CANTC|nr:uncharacterized protein CANTEDRAFT_115544 [Yamadazyma tenuis ATCC 10573]EGV62771.1 hypothetical protein CANTEDRAFT_115544 [Yamadazyma tenuis ATCC 10573]